VTTIDATFVQGNTGPDIVAQLSDQLTKVPLNLTTAESVRFQMRKPDDRVFTVDAACAVTNAASGLVSYSWSAGDLNVEGEYDAQWEVHWNDGKIQTVAVPNRILVRRK